MELPASALSIPAIRDLRSPFNEQLYLAPSSGGKIIENSQFYTHRDPTGQTQNTSAV